MYNNGDIPMGDHFELKELCGVWYIQFQTEGTNWQYNSVQLSDEESLELEALEGKHLEEMQAAMKSIVAKFK